MFAKLLRVAVLLQSSADSFVQSRCPPAQASYDIRDDAFASLQLERGDAETRSLDIADAHACLQAVDASPQTATPKLRCVSFSLSSIATMRLHGDASGIRSWRKCRWVQEMAGAAGA